MPIFFDAKINRFKDGLKKVMDESSIRLLHEESKVNPTMARILKHIAGIAIGSRSSTEKLMSNGESIRRIKVAISSAIQEDKGKFAVVHASPLQRFIDHPGIIHDITKE